MIDRETPPVPALVAELERLDRKLAVFGDGFRLVGNEYCGAFRWALQHAAAAIRSYDRRDDERIKEAAAAMEGGKQ